MVIVVLLALRRRKCFVLGHGCSPLLFLLGSFDVCVLRKLFVKLQKTVISVIPHELKWCDNLIVYDEKTLRWQFIVPDEFPFVPVRETQSGVLPTFSPDNTISGLPGLTANAPHILLAAVIQLPRTDFVALLQNTTQG